MLGIFGDSFAGVNDRPETAHFAWPTLLKNMLSTDVEVHAEGGSSLYWAYQQFIKHQSKYDKIIFVITSPGRYTKKVWLPHNNREFHINGELAADLWLDPKNNLPAADTEILNEMKVYYKYMDYEWDKLSCELLVDRISKIRPDAILVPGFRHWTSYGQLKNHNPSLLQILHIQLAKLRLSLESNYVSAENNIACHFTPETNLLIAEMMKASLEKGQWAGYIPGNIQHEYPASYYYNL
jgi:hypothetical protein